MLRGVREQRLQKRIGEAAILQDREEPFRQAVDPVKLGERPVLQLRDYLAALDSPDDLNALGGPNERYLVVADAPASEEVGVLSCARQPGGR